MSDQLSMEQAVKELVERAGASGSKSMNGEIQQWAKEFKRLTKSFTPSDYAELQELFGEDRIHSIYSAFPIASLAVTASFIRAIQNHRLASLLAQPPSSLSTAEKSTKALWEETICRVVDSVVDWCPSVEEDNKEAASQIGTALYGTLCPFITGNLSRRVGDDLKKAIADLLEQTVAGCKSNKLLLSNPSKGEGFLKTKTLGELFFSSTHSPYPLPSIYLDLIAHLNPRIKETDQRTKHAEVAFQPFSGVLGESLKKLMVETPNSEWYSTRAKLLTAVAQSDVNRLQLFPLLAVHQSSTGDNDLLDNEEDRDSIEKGIKLLYLDPSFIIFTWFNEDGEEESMSVAFKEIIKTTFRVEGAGADQTTLMSCETMERGLFNFKLGCSRAAIQRVCAKRPFATPIDSPAADQRRASVPAGPALMLPDSPIAGAEGSEEAEEEESLGEARFSQFKEKNEGAVAQQPPTPVNAPSTSAQAKIPPPSPRKPLSSAASSSSFVKKKIPPPHLNLDQVDPIEQPSSSNPSSVTATAVDQKPTKPKSTKPSSNQAPPAPKKPLSNKSSTTSKIAKLSKLSPPKAPALDASLFGKGNESDSDLSEASLAPSQSQSQVHAPARTTAGWKRKRAVDASQEDEEGNDDDEEHKRGSRNGKKQKTGRHRDPDEEEEGADDEDDLDLLNDDDGGGTSLAAPPTKQAVPRKTYGSTRKKSSAPPPSHPKPTPKKSVVGAMKPKSNTTHAGASNGVHPSSRSSPFPDIPSSPPNHHVDEMDEYDELPSAPKGGKINPIATAREPAPAAKTPNKSKAKGKGVTPRAKSTIKKTAAKKKKEEKSKETITSDDEEEQQVDESTKKGGGGRSLRNKSKSTVGSAGDGDEESVAGRGGRKSSRKSAVVARKRFSSTARDEAEEEDEQEEMVSEEEADDEIGEGGGKIDKGKGKERAKKEPTPPSQDYSYPADDDTTNFANDNANSPSAPSARNDFVLSPSQANTDSQPFAYEESQAVLGGATFKTQNSNGSDEMDGLGNDTNGSRDVEMDQDGEDGEEVAPMPDPLQYVDEEEEIGIVLSGEVGNSMPLGKKRMGSKDLGEERIRKKGTTTGAARRVGAIEEEGSGDVEMEMEEDGDTTIVQQKRRSVASSSISKGESFASVATAGTSAKSSKVPSPIKASKKNALDPWKNPDAIEKQLEANLAAAGMSGVVEQSRPIKALPSSSSINRSRAPSPPTALSSRSSSRQVEPAQKQPNPVDASKKRKEVAAASAPPPKKTGNRVVDSDSEEIEEDSVDENASEEIEEDEEEVVRSAHWPIKETMKRTAPPADGTRAQATPKLTPRNVRINSKPDYMGEESQPAAASSSTSTRTKPTSFAAPEPSKTTPVPKQSSSAPSSHRKEPQRPVVEAEGSQASSQNQSSSQPSSATKPASTTPQGPPPLVRASHIVHLPQPPAGGPVELVPKVAGDARSPTPQPRLPSVVDDQEQQQQHQPGRGRSRSPTAHTGKASDRHGLADRSRQGSAAPAPVPQKPINELADLVEGLEDREEEEGTSMLKQTLDIIVTELDKRYTNRVKKTQFKAKETQTRLTSDTQKLAHHLVNRTAVIVDASKKHVGILRTLNANVASTTREARLKSEDVVKEMERVVAREERRNELWPSSFFA